MPVEEEKAYTSPNQGAGQDDDIHLLAIDRRQQQGGRLWMRRSPGSATAPRRNASQRAGSTAIAVKTRATKNGQTAGPKRAAENVDQKVGSLKKGVPSSTAVEIVRTAPGYGRAPVRVPFGRRD